MRRLCVLTVSGALATIAALATGMGCGDFSDAATETDAPSGADGRDDTATNEGGIDDEGGTIGPTGTRLSALYAKDFGGANVGDAGTVVFAGDMFVDPNGGVVVAGSYVGGSVDMGGATLPAPASADAFVVKLDGNGAHLLSKAFSGNDDQFGVTLSGASAQLHIGMNFRNTLPLPPDPAVTSQGGGTLFNSIVVRLVDGFTPSGRANLLGSMNVLVRHTAIGTGSSVVSFGDYNNDIVFQGGSAQQRGGGKNGIFVSRTSHVSASDILEVKHCDESTACFAGGMATNGSGEVLAGGRYTGHIAFPDGGIDAPDDDDAYLMKLDAKLAIEWVVALTGAGVQETLAVASIPGSADFVAAGSFGGTFAAPGSPPVASKGETDIFVVRVDKSGTIVWSKTFGGAGADLVRGLSADGAGNVFLTGNFKGPTVELGGPPLVNADVGGKGTTDVFVAWLDGAGKHVYSERFGDDGNDDVAAIGLDAKNDVVIAGTFHGTLAFGGAAMPMKARGNTDMFVTKFARLTP